MRKDKVQDQEANQLKNDPEYKTTAGCRMSMPHTEKSEDRTHNRKKKSDHEYQA
jgi:hypothetical protein